MFSHCNRVFYPTETWFLFDNKNFRKRKLHLGICPICDNDVAELIETRISDGKIFRQLFYKKQVEKIIALLIKEVDYASNSVNNHKSTPCGICYGENKEIHNSKGEVIEIRQKRCDFFGNKEVTHTFSPLLSL